MHLTGKQRLFIVILTVWIVLVALVTLPWEYDFPHGHWKSFLAYGIAPVAAIIMFLWVRLGYQKDSENKA